MIDIHPPHHGAMTLRDFFIHLGIVVLGILIAIGLEQSVEYFHHRHLAADAHNALLAERAADARSNDFNIFVTRHHENILERDLAILHALREHTSVPTGPFILHHPRFLYPEAEWEKIHESGTVNYLTENLAPIAYRYKNQDAFMALADRSNEALYGAGSVLRTENDPIGAGFDSNLATNSFLNRIADSHGTLPQQEVDRGFATFAEHGDLSSLPPSQLDSLTRAIQIALVDDDAMLAYCFNIERNLTNNPEH